MSKTKLIILAAVGVLAPVAWFLLSPLIITKTVNENFDFSGGMPAKSEIMEMDKNQQMKTLTIIEKEMADKPTMVKEAMMANPDLLRQGNFRNADSSHKGSGDAKLYQLDDGSHVLRLENFEVTNGPDLKVYLVKHQDPSEASQVKQAGYLSLGPLKGNMGNQNYRVPAGTDINEYQSAVIWCELFGVLFSPAALK